jgi:serine/threonine protein kinase
VAVAGAARALTSGVDHVPETGDGSSTTTSASELPRGTRVGRYVVDALIGRGAMGVVYRARDPDLDRIVAVKLLTAAGSSEEARERLRRRLLREAQAMARLSHPEVMPVHDVGAFGERLFVAMEYVDGGTLRQWRAARHRRFGEILAVYERAGSGLAAAHDAGLVHRDFKPDNVLVGTDGRVRVTDFGLVRTVLQSVPQSLAPSATGAEPGGFGVALTHTGMLLGTPAYMAPEQLRGGVADARSDVFGFSVALYEALYGERPFAGATVAELQASTEAGAVRDVPLTTRVPRWVRAVLLRGLRAAPEQRLASMRALLDALRAGRARARRRAARAGAATALAVVASGLIALEAGRANTGVRRDVPLATGADSPETAPLPRRLETRSALDPIVLPAASPSPRLLDESLAPPRQLPLQSPPESAPLSPPLVPAALVALRKPLAVAPEDAHRASPQGAASLPSRAAAQLPNLTTSSVAPVASAAPPSAAADDMAPSVAPVASAPAPSAAVDDTTEGRLGKNASPILR